MIMEDRFELEVLNNQQIVTGISVDGDSLPFVELVIKGFPSTTRIQGWCFISKEQLEELVKDLQRKLAAL